jgi:hypothetical protein
MPWSTGHGRSGALTAGSLFPLLILILTPLIVVILTVAFLGYALWRLGFLLWQLMCLAWRVRRVPEASSRATT